LQTTRDATHVVSIRAASVHHAWSDRANLLLQKIRRSAELTRPSVTFLNIAAMVSGSVRRTHMKLESHYFPSSPLPASSSVLSHHKHNRKSLITLIGLIAICLSCMELQAASPTSIKLKLEPARRLSALEPVIITATVVAHGHPVSPGIVTFCDASARFCEDNAVVGTVSLQAGGTGSLKKVFPVGAHSVYAIFNTTQTDAGSRSETVSFEVGSRTPTNTTLGKVPGGDQDSVRATITAVGTPPIEGFLALLDDAGRRPMLSPVLHSQLKSSFSSVSSYVSQSLPYGPIEQNFGNGIVSGDFNGDGLPDVAVTVNFGEGDVGGAGIALFLNDAAHPGNFLPQPVIPIAGGLGINLLAADFNQDGLVDLVVECLAIGSSQECLLLNDPSNPGHFTLTIIATSGSFSRVADMNQDGVLDLVGTSVGGNVDIFFGDAANPGKFINETALADRYANDFEIADINGDGVLDLVTADYAYENSGVSVFLGDPHKPGSLLEPVLYPTGAFTDPSGIAIGDFNHDGLPDIATVLYSGDVDILTNRPEAPGQFSGPIAYPVDSYPFFLTTGAFQSRDSLDIAVIEGNGLFVLPSDPSHPGEFLSAVGYPLPPGNYAFGLNAADYNADGANDLAETFYLSDSSTPSSNIALGMLLNQPVRTSTIDFSLPSYRAGEWPFVQAYYSGDLNYKGSSSCPIDGKTGNAATPVINDLGAHDIRRTSADITWSGIATTARISYGKTTALGNVASAKARTAGPLQSWESLPIERLDAGTKYYFQLTSSLAVEGCPKTTSVSPILSFSTLRK
jgi:hypothetical protein